MNKILATMLVATLTLTAAAAQATPITLNDDGTRYYDIDFYIESSITLAYGEVNYLQAAILNKGTEAITFDSVQYFWNIGTPQCTLGLGGAETIWGINYAWGHKEDLGPTRFNIPNFSHLADMVIAPGEMLAFDYMTLELMREDLVGHEWTRETCTYLYLGNPLFAGFRTDRYSLNIFSGETGSQGAVMQRVGVTNFEYFYAPNSAPVPEPATILLFGTGLVGLVGAGLKRKKK